MFDQKVDATLVGIGEGPAGASGDTADEWYFNHEFDEFVYQLTLEAENEVATRSAHRLPLGLESIPPGPLLAAALGRVDRSQLNGYDLVRLLQARERMVAHCQAQSMADMVDISYASPGTEDSPPERMDEAAEFAADEIRAALTMTRRSAESRMTIASEVRERLPSLWSLFDEGVLDWSRVMVIVKGVSHLSDMQARNVVETIADRASRLTTGQLAAWIRRLCVDASPEEAKQRYEHAVDNRRVWLEQTVDGTGNLHLLDIPIEDLTAIGRRINRHMINLRKRDDDRTHDQLRADIATDMLLGSNPRIGGRGLVDIRVDLTTLAGLDDRSAEIPGLGPVIADIARKVADQQHKAEWRATVTDENGDVVHLVTTSRRPTTAISRITEATQPTCSYPGCRMPARDSDFDHLESHAEGGETSTRNGGPKCRHDHVLKDHGWTHRRVKGKDIWTSPLGHTYITIKPP